MSLSSFSKIRGKDIYYVEYGTDYVCNITSWFDSKKFQQIFKSVDCEFSSIGICIEPLTAEERIQASRGNKITLNEIRDGSMCLLFYTPDSIDRFIKILNCSKEALVQKIKERKEEEYRKKYCGKVILINDLLRQKAVSPNDQSGLRPQPNLKTKSIKPIEKAKTNP